MRGMKILPTHLMTEAELIREECERNIEIRSFNPPKSFAECLAQLNIINRAQALRRELDSRSTTACV